MAINTPDKTTSQNMANARVPKVVLSFFFFISAFNYNAVAIFRNPGRDCFKIFICRAFNHFSVKIVFWTMAGANKTIPFQFINLTAQMCTMRRKNCCWIILWNNNVIPFKRHSFVFIERKIFFTLNRRFKVVQGEFVPDKNKKGGNPRHNYFQKCPPAFHFLLPFLLANVINWTNLKPDKEISNFYITRFVQQSLSEFSLNWFCELMFVFVEQRTRSVKNHCFQ